MKPAVANLAWAPIAGSLPVEVFTLRSLVDRAGRKIQDQPEQLQFDLVIHCTGGTGSHMVDFEAVSLKPDELVHIRPGQIHQWQLDDDYDATLSIINNLHHHPSLDWSIGPQVHSLTAAQQTQLGLIYQLYEQDWATTSGAEGHALAVNAVSELLQAVLTLTGGADIDGHPPPTPYLALRADLERHLDHRQTIQKRARRLGYATKTLDRACHQALGKTAKQMSDERFSLEARRLLVLPGSQASEVGRKLGFTESTNFTKFIKRVTGKLPSEWQQQSK